MKFTPTFIKKDDELTRKIVSTVPFCLGCKALQDLYAQYSERRWSPMVHEHLAVLTGGTAYLWGSNFKTGLN